MRFRYRPRSSHGPVSDKDRKRQRAQRRGRAGERRASWFLRLKGYSILERQWRSHQGEIDLIVRRGKILVFVEVKVRRSLAEAIQSITVRQRARICASAEIFLARRQAGRKLIGSAIHEVRFDVIAMTRNGIPRHLKDAWRPE